MKYAPRKVYIKESGGYVELSYTDFCRRRQADKGYMDKLFIPVQGCLLEVVREQYADFYRDRERWRYLQKLDARNSLLSLDGFTDSEGNPLDFIADEAADIAETVVNAVMVDRLKAALPLLSDSEQELIQAIFFDGLSEREVGARLVYTILDNPKYSHFFEFIVIAEKKRITKESFQKFLEGQDRYKLDPSNDYEELAQEQNIALANFRRKKLSQTGIRGSNGNIKYLTFDEASYLAKVSRSMINKWADTGKFTVIKVGSRVRIRRDEFEDWMEQRDLERSMQ